MLGIKLTGTEVNTFYLTIVSIWHMKNAANKKKENCINCENKIQFALSNGHL